MRRIERIVWAVLVLAVCWVLDMSAHERHRGFYERLFSEQCDARDYVVEIYRTAWQPGDVQAVGDEDVSIRLPLARERDDDACDPQQDVAETSVTKGAQ
ncbi:hypothetical protein M3I54_00990 [Paraburkholderia sp. CNPSo 3274]|uniref:hypothetical protein n=1 Tax=Paraburkholderia sp. CNPSo 3274 TaxID=2940932 RepID=UPI0020B8A227|nr:hypothetical protein [Paraburkholderia sp. CNPSo 3274]MCP3705579.1 hypothetical protein [Paraburkholderia sp. CNPSo 3274]